ncbi:MAG: hypothetical protein Q8Q18_00125 [bacterium]|nr:hypothetical protein [bacterium]
MKSRFNAQAWRILFGRILVHRDELIKISILGIFAATGSAVVPYLVGILFDLLSGDRALFLPDKGLSWNLFLVLAVWLIVQLVVNVTDWLLERKNRYLSTFIQNIPRGFATREPCRKV